MKATYLPPIKPRHSLQLELEYEEAVLLAKIIGRIGGSPSNPARELIIRLYDAILKMPGMIELQSGVPQYRSLDEMTRWNHLDYLPDNFDQNWKELLP